MLRYCFYIILFFIYGCGFVVEKKIRGPYYFIAVDTKEDLSIDYRLKSGDYAGRIPSIVNAYYTNDTLIIAEVKKYYNDDKDFSYYFLKTNLDHELAHLEEGEILFGPLNRKKYDSTVRAWDLKVILKKIKF